MPPAKKRKMAILEGPGDPCLYFNERAYHANEGTCLAVFHLEEKIDSVDARVDELDDSVCKLDDKVTKFMDDTDARFEKIEKQLQSFSDKFEKFLLMKSP